MVEGRRGRTQENYESHATADRSACVLPGRRNVNRSEGGDFKSQPREHFDNRDNADGGHNAFNVDRRANHGAGRRQRNFADNLRRNRGGTAEKHRDNLPVPAGGHDKLFQRGTLRGNRGWNGRVRNFRRGGLPARTDNLRKARRRSQSGRRTHEPHSAESKSGGRHSDNFRVERADVPADGRAVRRRAVG